MKKVTNAQARKQLLDTVKKVSKAYKNFDVDIDFNYLPLDDNLSQFGKQQLIGKTITIKFYK